MEVAASEGEEEQDITNKSAKIKKEELDKRVSTRREKLRGDSREEENVDEGQTCVCDCELSSLRGVVPLRADLNSERRNLPKEQTSSSSDLTKTSSRSVNVMSEGRTYLHSKVVAEMVKWYLGSGVVGGGRIVVEGTNEACPSLPAFSPPSSPLLLLIGAGGMLYMMRRSLQEEEQERQQEENYGLWGWVKWFRTEKSNSPALPPARPAAIKDTPFPLPSVPSSEDRSLNSLTSPCSPRKLLTKPLYVANPRARHVLTRASLPPTGTPSFKRQGRAERRQGDGMELTNCSTEERLTRAVQEELAKSSKLRPTSALFMCRGEPDGQDQWSRASSVCRSRASSLGKMGDMGEVVRQAREVRRLIREASVDSQASDLCLNAASDFCVEYDGPWSSPLLPGSPEEPICWESETEDSGLRQWEGDCRSAWRLTGPGSFVSEDWASEAGSLDPWEWDEEGWLEENNVGEEEVDKKMGDSQLLPNLCAELDLESELWASVNNNRPSSAASTASDDVTISASPL